MKIFVDADACPVVRIVEKLAKKYEIPCVLLCDTNHVLRSERAVMPSIKMENGIRMKI